MNKKWRWFYIASVCSGIMVHDIDAEPLSTQRTGQLEQNDYSFGYWENGWRKNPDDLSKDILSIETGHFGLKLDMDQLDKARFGTFNDSLGYSGALAADGKRMQQLKEVELAIDIEHAGQTYRATTCRAGSDLGVNRLKSTRMWESGRIAQHYDIKGLDFWNKKGQRLPVTGTLDIVAWPDSLTFSTDLKPTVFYKDGVALGVVGKGLCVINKPVTIPHHAGMEKECFTVETWVKVPESLETDTRSWLLCKNRNEQRDGNFGFMLYRGGVTALMNIGGGPGGQYSIDQRGYGHKLREWSHLVLSYDGRKMSFSSMVYFRVKKI